MTRQKCSSMEHLVTPLELVRLPALMARTSGRPDVRIALIDGPVLTRHPELSDAHIEQVLRHREAACTMASREACLHATFLAGLLTAKRSSGTPGICPDCTLLVRPIFGETVPASGLIPTATPAALAEAILDCVEAGAGVINLSLALQASGLNDDRALNAALAQAARRGVLVVAAAGNQGALAGSLITRHPWVIPVVACDLRSRPLGGSNLSNSIGRHGLSAPGDNIAGLGVNGPSLTLGGTSVATAFVTGAAALLWSAVPTATAAEVRHAITNAIARRTSIVPPLLDAAAALQALLQVRRETA